MSIVDRWTGDTGGGGGGGGMTPHPLDYHTDVTYTPSPQEGYTLKWNGSEWIPSDDQQYKVYTARYTGQSVIDLHVSHIGNTFKAAVLPKNFNVLVRWQGTNEPDLVDDFTVFGDGVELTYKTDWFFYSGEDAFNYRKNQHRRSYHGVYNDGTYNYQYVDIIVLLNNTLSEVTVIKREKASDNTVHWEPQFSDSQLNVLNQLTGIDSREQYTDVHMSAVSINSDLALKEADHTVFPRKVITAGTFTSASLVNTSQGTIPGSAHLHYRSSYGYHDINYVMKSQIHFKAPDGMVLEIYETRRTWKKYKKPRVTILGSEHIVSLDVGYIAGPVLSSIHKPQAPFFIRARTLDDTYATKIVGPFGTKKIVYSDPFSPNPESNRYVFMVPYWPSK